MKQLKNYFTKYKDYEQIGSEILNHMNAQDGANEVLNLKLQHPRTNQEQILYDQVITYLLNQQ